MGSLMSQDSRDCHIPNPSANLPVVSPFDHGSWLKETQREEQVSPTWTPNIMGQRWEVSLSQTQRTSLLGPDSYLMSVVHTSAHTSALSHKAGEASGHPTLSSCKASKNNSREDRGQGGAAGCEYLELVRPQLIDVGAGPGLWLIPEAELQKQLVSPGQQHLAPLLPELQVLLEEEHCRHRGQGNMLPCQYALWVAEEFVPHSHTGLEATCTQDAGIPCCFLACSCSP